VHILERKKKNKLKNPFFQLVYEKFEEKKREIALTFLNLGETWRQGTY